MLHASLALVLLSAATTRVIVTPEDLQGWIIGSSSREGGNSGRVWIDQAPLAARGVGSLWFATGNGRPSKAFVFARSDHYRGRAVGDFEFFSHDTFVSPQSASEWDKNWIAFTLVINMDGDGKRVEQFISAPAGEGNIHVKKGVWQRWSSMNSPFYLLGSSGTKPLSSWLRQLGALRPTIDHFVIGVGDYHSRNKLNFLGAADQVTVKFRGQPAVTYDFELRGPSPSPERSQPSPNQAVASTTGSSLTTFTIITASQPSFYYFWGQPCGVLIYNDGKRVSKDQVKEEAKGQRDSESEKKPPYWVEDDLYVPIGFRGNVNFAEIFLDTSSNSRYEPINKGGGLVFGGVPFILDTDKQVWFAGLADDVTGGLHSKPKNAVPRVAKLGLETPKLSNLKRLYTLINTVWGDMTKSWLELEVKYESGKKFTKALMCNADIRDQNMEGNTLRKITGTTKQVWGRNDQLGALRNIVLDMQSISIPDEFWNETVASITFTDTGAHEKQRSYVVGITAQVGNVKKVLVE